MAVYTSSTALTTDGNYPASPGYIEWHGGSGILHVAGTFDGATVKLQWSIDATTWVDAGSDTSFTASGGGVFTAGEGIYLRVNIANDGASTSVKAAIRGMGAGR